MIPMQNIVAWGAIAPWADQRQVEQDLIVSRALVDIFSDGMLRIVLEPWLGPARFDQSPMAPKFRFRVDAEDGSM